MSATVTVGEHLATWLAQLGCHELFGLPGDYDLALLDEMLAAESLSWIGCTNELNAATATSNTSPMPIAR